ncbi:MAG: twin-arginine translocase TatA/TatE family subunit [Candidatus Omnitrophota bacterium]
MCRLGLSELLVVLLVVVLLFGAAKLPALGRALGEAIREFRKSAKNRDKKGS